MNVKLIATGETMKLRDGYAMRMVEQGNAVPCEKQRRNEKTKEKPEEGDEDGTG